MEQVDRKQNLKHPRQRGRRRGGTVFQSARKLPICMSPLDQHEAEADYLTHDGPAGH